MQILNAAQTAELLPYPRLTDSIAEVLRDWQRGAVRVPERTVVELEADGKLLVMPAADSRLGIVKLVTVHPRNSGRGLATIQGEVVVLRAATGERLALLDGSVVTARRTAALSLLAARELAPRPAGPLLVIGAGAQARSHIEAFRAGLGTETVFISSRTRSRAVALADHARSLGLEARVVDDPRHSLADAKLVVTATNSREPVLREPLASDVMVCAVGAFSHDMAELSPELIAGSAVVVDTLEAARTEAGDLIQAVAAGAWSWRDARELVDLLGGDGLPAGRPVLFKSVGHALFDLASARLALPVG